MTIVKNYILRSLENRRKFQLLFVGQTYFLTGEIEGKSIREDVYIVGRREVKIIKTGEVVKIEEPHPDYDNFAKAAGRGIPIINSWNIKGNKKEGYYITGFVNLIPIIKKIKKQNGNYLILEDNSIYFVMWHDYSVECANSIIERKTLAEDIKFPSDFNMFGNSCCKPNIIVL